VNQTVKQISTHFHGPTLAATVMLLATAAHASPATTSAPSAAACTAANTGITLSPGFCATVFADNLGHVRHLTVAPDGTVYANRWSGRYYHNDTPPSDGFEAVGAGPGIWRRWR
jgi:glucose/arabinose dehydrogenase